LLVFLSACTHIRLSSDIPLEEGQSFNYMEYDFNHSSIDYKFRININDYLFRQKFLKLPFKKATTAQEGYNIPIYTDDRVNYFLDLYGNRFASTFQRWLDRSNLYMSIVQDIFIKEGLPSDLACLAFTESGFNPTAASWANAVGMWQFIESTGKLYGLKNNFWIDERKDFLKATHAAAKHLKDLYNEFGDWYLAIAAYNAGMYKILNGIERYKTPDFKKLSTYNYLKEETKDYVPKFIAMLILYKNLSLYGFSYPLTPDILFETVEFDKPVNLFAISKLIDEDYDELKELNPELKRPITPPGQSFQLKIPYGKKSVLLDELRNVNYKNLIQVHIYSPKNGEDINSIAKKYGVSEYEIKEINGLYYNRVSNNRPIFIPIKGTFDKSFKTMFAKAVAYDLPNIYVVKNGDTLYGISRKCGISLNTLLALNKDINPNRIKPGDKVLISWDIKKQIIYKVKKGDTLWEIAKKFKTSVIEIRKTNRIYSANLRPGDKLIIPD
jgi:membrane-bound lytic murein transglycosylase D